MNAEDAIRKNAEDAKAARKARKLADAAKAKRADSRQASAVLGKVITILKPSIHPAGTISAAAWMVLVDFDGKASDEFIKAVAPICRGNGYLKEWMRRGNISLT